MSANVVIFTQRKTDDLPVNYYLEEARNRIKGAVPHFGSLRMKVLACAAKKASQLLRIQDVEVDLMVDTLTPPFKMWVEEPQEYPRPIEGFEARIKARLPPNTVCDFLHSVTCLIASELMQEGCKVALRMDPRIKAGCQGEVAAQSVVGPLKVATFKFTFLERQVVLY